MRCFKLSPNGSFLGGGLCTPLVPTSSSCLIPLPCARHWGFLIYSSKWDPAAFPTLQLGWGWGSQAWGPPTPPCGGPQPLTWGPQAESLPSLSVPAVKKAKFDGPQGKWPPLACPPWGGQGLELSSQAGWMWQDQRKGWGVVRGPQAQPQLW